MAIVADPSSGCSTYVDVLIVQDDQGTTSIEILEPEEEVRPVHFTTAAGTSLDTDSLLPLSPPLTPSPSPTAVSPSSPGRPFKLIVRNRTFLVDADLLSSQSPIFASATTRRSFSGTSSTSGSVLSRRRFSSRKKRSSSNTSVTSLDHLSPDDVAEIVDEKQQDVEVLLAALDDPQTIDEFTFPTVLRLARKYQFVAVAEQCAQFVQHRADLSRIKPDQVLTLLIAAHDHALGRPSLESLIHRLAREEKSAFNRLKLSRYLPASIYGAIMATNLNMRLLGALECMNGHYLQTERQRIKWRRGVCQLCKITSTATARCDGCRKTMCEKHVADTPCTSDWGRRVKEELQNGVVPADVVF